MSRDLMAGLVVFLVAVPLSLGLAAASSAPPSAGLIAAAIGGILVGLLSKSQTSISGPAVGLTVVVASQAVALGSYSNVLLAIVLAGVIQIVLGLTRCGVLVAFFPSSVTKGFLAAIGVILILKQLPHVIGHDADPEGDFDFQQSDHQNTFSELFLAADDALPGAAVIGLLSIALLFLWDRIRALKRVPVPAPLFVVLLGIGLGLLFEKLGGYWAITPNHFVQVSAPDTTTGLMGAFKFPNFTQLRNPAVYLAAILIAAAASLETLLNLRATDKLDPQRRTSPPSRELWAHGVSNIVSGLVGGLPITSVITRSSVSINAGARTKAAAIFQGILLVIGVIFLVDLLNMIPLACLAAILLVTGVKLVSPAVVRQMWAGGKYQFAPFAVTVVAFVLTNLLIGVLIGLAVSISFILWSNAHRPIRTIIEKHVGDEVVHIELAAQVSFLNRVSLAHTLDEVPAGGHVLLDARGTDYIDPDILNLIRDFTEQTGPARGIEVSLLGFRTRYQLQDQIQYVDYSSRDLQASITPAQVLEILKAGHERFRSGRRLTRDLGRSVQVTADSQHPLAVVLSCIDSRSPAEIVFDLGMGDIFSVRIAGAVTSGKVLGSIEYACAVAGAKLIVVMGHTRCGAVTSAVRLFCSKQEPGEATGCDNIEGVVSDIQKAIDPMECDGLTDRPAGEQATVIDGVARRNVSRVVAELMEESRTLAKLISTGEIAVVGAMYDVATGNIEFLPDAAANLSPLDIAKTSDLNGTASRSLEADRTTAMDRLEVARG